MRRMATVLLGVLLSLECSADCLPSTRSLVQISATRCQGLVVFPDQSQMEGWKSDPMRGTLVTGKILDSKQVVPNSPVFARTKKPQAGEFESFFVWERSSDICEPVARAKTFWLISVNPCCDTIPPGPECWLPGSLPLMQREKDPGLWIEVPD